MEQLVDMNGVWHSDRCDCITVSDGQVMFGESDARGSTILVLSESITVNVWRAIKVTLEWIDWRRSEGAQASWSRCRESGTVEYGAQQVIP